MVHTMTGSITLAWINHVENQKKRTRFVNDTRFCFIYKHDPQLFLEIIVICVKI
jgi:hypothetical protein